MSQHRTPYLRALSAYAGSDTRRFHLPGHMGQGGSLQQLVTQTGWCADTSAVLDLDDIHYPYGPLGQAQDLAAMFYGARQTCFLVNGSTAGIQALSLAFLGEGDTVVLPRNAHRSVHGALALSGARPIYAPVPYDPSLGVFHSLEPATLDRVLQSAPGCRVCFLETLSPYGAAADIRALVQTAHAHGAMAFVDEAWGAHLVASPRLPLSACAVPADAVVQSAHKTLSALGQGAWLHIFSARLDDERLSAALRLLQTSSPSSLILASLDEARWRLATEGTAAWERTLDLAAEVRQRIASETCLACPNLPGGDPTRLVISGRAVGCEGALLECRLRYRHRIQVDMSDRFQALLSLTPAHTSADGEALVSALAEVGESGRGLSPDIDLPPFPVWQEAPLTPRQATQAAREAVPLQEAAGRVSAKRITVYPPGMALICAGELISAEQVDYLREAQAFELPIEGLAGDNEVYCVKAGTCSL